MGSTSQTNRICNTTDGFPQAILDTAQDSSRRNSVVDIFSRDLNRASASRVAIFDPADRIVQVLQNPRVTLHLRERDTLGRVFREKPPQ